MNIEPAPGIKGFGGCEFVRKFPFCPEVTVVRDSDIPASDFATPKYFCQEHRPDKEEPNDNR